MSYEKVPGKDSLQKLYSLNPPPAWPPSRSEFPSGRDFRVIFDSHYEPDREKDRYGSMRMLASRLREKGLNDRILEGKDKDKEKGKGKEKEEKEEEEEDEEEEKLPATVAEWLKCDAVTALSDRERERPPTRMIDVLAAMSKEKKKEKKEEEKKEEAQGFQQPQQ